MNRKREALGRLALIGWALAMGQIHASDEGLRPDLKIEEQAARSVCGQFLHDLGLADWAKAENRLAESRRDMLLGAEKHLVNFITPEDDAPLFDPLHTSCDVVFKLDATKRAAFLRLTFEDAEKVSHTVFFRLVKDSMNRAGRDIKSWRIHTAFPTRLDRFFLWADGRSVDAAR